jgi:hypothetical protein
MPFVVVFGTAFDQLDNFGLAAVLGGDAYDLVKDEFD